jgi:hypothetical protein
MSALLHALWLHVVLRCSVCLLTVQAQLGEVARSRLAAGADALLVQPDHAVAEHTANIPWGMQMVARHAV